MEKHPYEVSAKKKPPIWTWDDVEWNGQRHKSNGHLQTIEERQSL